MNTQKSLILTLIKNDLLNTRLVNGLNKLGLQADEYLLNLDETVFTLLGHDEDDPASEKLYERYLQLCRQAEQVAEGEELERLVISIYEEIAA